MENLTETTDEFKEGYDFGLKSKTHEESVCNLERLEKGRREEIILSGLWAEGMSGLLEKENEVCV